MDMLLQVTQALKSSPVLHPDNELVGMHSRSFYQYNSLIIGNAILHAPIEVNVLVVEHFKEWSLPQGGINVVASPDVEPEGEGPQSRRSLEN